MNTHRRKAEDRKLLIDKDQVKAFDEGLPKFKAIQLIEDYNKDNKKVIKRSDFCAVRDYLMVELELANAARSGVVVNVLLEKFNVAVLLRDFVNIPVWQHKTVSTYGSALFIIFDKVYKHLKILLTDQLRLSYPNIYQHLKIFVSRFRSDIHGCGPTLFTS